MSKAIGDMLLEATGFNTTSTPGVNVTYHPQFWCHDMQVTYDIKQTAGRHFRRQQMEGIDIEIGRFYINREINEVCQVNVVRPDDLVEITYAKGRGIYFWEINEFDSCWEIAPEVEEGSIWFDNNGTEAIRVDDVRDEVLCVSWYTRSNPKSVLARGTISWHELYTRYRLAPSRPGVELPVLGEHHDAVDFPIHYDVVEGVQAIDVIEAKVPDFGSYCEGNVIKYLMRWRDKNGVEDLKKAQRYLEWLIAEEEGDG